MEFNEKWNVDVETKQLFAYVTLMSEWMVTLEKHFVMWKCDYVCVHFLTNGENVESALSSSLLKKKLKSLTLGPIRPNIYYLITLVIITLCTYM